MMVNKAELETALKEALRSGDALRKTTLRMVLSAIKLAEIEKGVSLDENGILSVLQKEVKSRREAIIDAQRANRPDLVTASEAEIVILESFLPKAMSPEELEALARRAIQEVGATSPREMGQVMKVLIPLLQGRASGDQASQVVKKLLQ
jgi:uncharacterized protein YqeY